MRYCVFGPFDVPRTNRNRIIDSHKRAIRFFWEDVALKSEALPEGGGCYIFGMRAGRGIKPWYVGMTKRSFSSECFNHSNVNKYNWVVSRQRRGTPVIYLIARVTNSGAISHKNTSSQKVFEAIESMLIGAAIRKNKDLLNVRGTSFASKIIVPGFLNSPKGKLPSSAADLKKLLG